MAPVPAVVFERLSAISCSTMRRGIRFERKLIATGQARQAHQFTFDDPVPDRQRVSQCATAR
jgi:hypothetical protein